MFIIKILKNELRSRISIISLVISVVALVMMVLTLNESILKKSLYAADMFAIPFKIFVGMIELELLGYERRCMLPKSYKISLEAEEPLFLFKMGIGAFL
jgi:hypothetical protein